MNGTSKTTTSGYKAASGQMIEAFPPLFIAANRAQALKAFNTSLRTAHMRFHPE
jgi:hypothetical protein